MSTSLRAYLADGVGRKYEPRIWDCGKFAVGWLAQLRPEGARAAARLLVELGYNDLEVGDDRGLTRLYRRFGARTPRDLADQLYVRLRDHVFPPPLPRPGDIAIQHDSLAFGIVDDDYQAVYLGQPWGYVKIAVRPQDALLRAL